VNVTIPDACLEGVLLPRGADADADGPGQVRRALREPIGAPRLRDIVHPGERVTVVTSDITRPIPSAVVLPEVLSELDAAGVRRRDVTVVFALGSHRKHTQEEKRRLVSDAVYETVRCVDSDGGDCVRLGVTSRGTPVDVFAPVAAADRVVCLGNIEYHYFAGYSGGMKAIMPGVSTRDAIQANHSLMTLDAAAPGRLDGNPVREDIEETARFLRVDFIVNVVLDEKKRIIRAFAGHPVRAHREGCAFLDGLYGIPIARRADIVVVSPGGFPKDINLYQAQKALDNAGRAVREGGVVILVAACPDGLGEEVFAHWILRSTTPDAMVAAIRERFELGGHKAAAIAMIRQRARIFLVSELDPGLTVRCFMEPRKDVDAALAAAFAALGPDARVLLMPCGGSTLPRVAPEGGIPNP
jgi:nickel-dependent lactate racemase